FEYFCSFLPFRLRIGSHVLDGLLLKPFNPVADMKELGKDVFGDPVKYQKKLQKNKNKAGEIAGSCGSAIFDDFSQLRARSRRLPSSQHLGRVLSSLRLMGQFWGRLSKI